MACPSRLGSELSDDLLVRRLASRMTTAAQLLLFEPVQQDTDRAVRTHAGRIYTAAGAPRTRQ
eukprot:306894-Prymnesium_polylepis.1